MKNPQTAMWTVGALLVAALLAVLAYFFAIQPQLDAAADARAAKEEAQNTNDFLSTQILAAQTKAKEVPLWLGEMDAIAIDLPPVADQAALHRLITDVLVARNLPVVSMTYEAPQIITPPVPETAPVAEPSTDIADGTVEGETAPSPSPAPAPAPVEPAAPGTVPAEVAFEGLVGLPVSVTTEGTPADVMGMIADLYAQDDRFLTVTAVDLRRAEIAEETLGRRALTTSDWVVTVTFLSFSLLDGEKSYPDDSGGKTAPYVDGTVINPFVPLPGAFAE